MRPSLKMSYYPSMGNELFDLSGKVALVTGGNRGIGLALAGGLAEQGADIAIVARTAEQLEAARKQISEKTGRQVWTFAADIGDVEALDEVFAGIVEAVGQVDILVNCAGTTVRGDTENMDLDGWRRVMDVNLTAVYRFCQLFCKHRKQAGTGGRIINIGSLTCLAARPTVAAYATSKGGLLMLTRTLAVEWAKYGINVNAIGPGYIRTALTQPLQDDENFDAWVLSKTPAGRWGLPKDMIGAAVLFASKAGEFITGQIVYVDGGWVALL